MNTNEFLAYFQNVKKHSSNQYTALCPAHGDKHNSLSIGYRSDKSHWLIYCHAGCDCKDILNAVGLKMSDLYDNTSNSKHIESQKLIYTKMKMQSLFISKQELTTVSKIKHSYLNNQTAKSH